MNYDLTPAATPKTQISYAKMAKSVTIGLIFALFSTVLLLILFAFIVNATFGDPDSVLHIFTVIGASIGAFIGGFRASRLNGSNGLLAGLFTGSAATVVLFTTMLFASEPTAVSVETNVTFRLVMVLCIILFACVGGILAVNFNRGRKIGNFTQRKR